MSGGEPSSIKRILPCAQQIGPFVRPCVQLIYKGGHVLAYQALYRKYRPQTFSEVYGQEHITKILESEIESGKIGHAYLFTGTRGTGKTTCAKILARAVNCEN